MGPPGTGKTLLALVVTGKAQLPFLFISGSAFVALLVGAGSSRVRELLAQVKYEAF